MSKSAHTSADSLIATLCVAASAALASNTFADNTPQSLPFYQDWTNTGMITTANDWSGVPGIIGYRGDDITTASGTDPQTLLVDGTNTPINVIANQTNPNTLSTGGIAEFEIPNPVVALNGSGTADAPFILVTLNTTGLSQITISYLLRDIDGSTDNSIQPIALHYRIGNTGNFTNVPAAFVADASSNVFPANTLVTRVSVELPPDADNRPILQFRIMTTNAVGNDEWIGIDNICVTSGLVDTDADGVADCIDNCPNAANPTQSDCDHDGLGDVCDDPCPGDKDGDGIPDRQDNCSGIFNPGQEDCNQNGIGDVCDIFFRISLDCNNNSIPDECEPDCNGNAVPDDCDLTNGTSFDNNNNGILDECENNTALVINEINADPAIGLAGDANNDGVSNSSDDEFVELINNTGQSLNISGWTVSDASTIGVRHTFPFGTVIQDQCGVIVFGGGNPTGQFGGMVVQRASTGALGLNNAGDTVTIKDNLGLFVTSYTYGGEGGDDTSLTRNPDITGLTPLVKHILANPALAYSAGKKLTGDPFSGCTAQPDSDNDGIPNASDNCPNNPNPDQADCDGDGIGNVCDTDPDRNNNGIPDICEVSPPANLRINEVRIDQPGADNDEYLELKGTPGQSLNGLTLVVLGDGTAAQASGVIESIMPLQGHTVPADGHFLLTESTFSLALAAQQDKVVFGGNPGALNFENSDSTTFIIVTNFTGALNQDLDTNDDGILDITPWSAVVDAVGLIKSPPPPTAGNEYPYGASLGFADVGPDTTVPNVNLAPSHIYRCERNGTWTVGKYDPFDASGGTDTPGVTNLACVGGPPPCPADINGDHQVGVNDLLAVIGNWGPCAPPCPRYCNADINHDCNVGVNDLLAVIGNWGPCPQ